MAGHLTVEERLEKARLMPRVSPELLQLCVQTDKLLLSSHQSNLSQAIVACQEIAREAPAVVVALRWTVTLVDLLESDIADVRLAACNALAAVSVAQEGRDAIRTAGGLRPLVLLLGGGSRSGAAAAAALALMNCSACDVCKEAIADCRGVPMLLNLIREAVARTHATTASAAASASAASTASGASSTTGQQLVLAPPSGAAAAAAGAAAGAAGAAGADGLRTPGDCKAAGYAAGALMNMGGVADVQDRMMEAGAVEVFEEAVRAAAPGDLVATRAQFCLSWLAVGSGAVPDEPPPPEPLTQPPPGLVPGGGGSRRQVPVASPRYPSTSGAAPAAAATTPGRAAPSGGGGGGGGSRLSTPLAGAPKPPAGSALAAIAASRGATPLGGSKPGAAPAAAASAR